MNITKRAVELLSYAKQGNAADYRWDVKLKGFGVRIYPSGRRAFLVTYRNAHGTKRFLQLGDFGHLTVEQARRLAQEKLSEVRHGSDPQLARAKAREELTLDALASRYLDHVRSYKRSWDDDAQRLRDHILPTLGRKRLSEIGRADIQCLLGQLKDRLSPSTANRCAALLRHMLNTAEKWSLVGRSPAKGITLYREPPPRDIFLSPDECRRIIDACGTEPNLYAAALFKLAMFTGRRIGELLKARWGDLSLERKTLTVHATKAGERQFVFLNDAAVALLDALPRMNGNPYLIAGQQQGKALVHYHPAWRRVLRRANVAYIPPHGLRHSYASTLVADGVPIETVGHLLGHRSSITTRRYAHHRPDQLLRATQRFSDLVTEASDG